MNSNPRPTAAEIGRLLQLRNWQREKDTINQTNKKPQGQTIFVAGEKCFTGNTWIARYAEALKLSLKPQYTPPPPKQKPLNVQKFTSQSLVYLHSTCYLFHTYSIQPGGHVKNVPDVCKKSTTSFAQYYVRVNQFRSRRQ